MFIQKGDNQIQSGSSKKVLSSKKVVSVLFGCRRSGYACEGKEKDYLVMPQKTSQKGSGGQWDREANTNDSVYLQLPFIWLIRS